MNRRSLKTGVKKNSNPFRSDRSIKVSRLYSRRQKRLWDKFLHARVSGFAGHLESYAQSHEILKQFTQVQISASQVYRITDHVSGSLVSEDKKTERLLPPVSKEDVLYVEVDGFMLCTREKEPWKEVKLGRLFKGSDCMNHQQYA